MLLPAPGARRTAYTLVLAWTGRTWACVVSAWANRLTRDAAAAGLLPALSAYPAWRPEVPWGESRLDFLLSGAALPPCLVEVKGVTLVGPDSVARFPDAPTARGARHLHELIRAAESGQRGAVVFAVQRPDATCVTPNQTTDPAFATALVEAQKAGVLLLAFTTQVSPAGLVPDRAIPVYLG
ncbi:MAG: DNA/RNA nuclease SfsA [Chitinophagales bacterium]